MWPGKHDERDTTPSTSLREGALPVDFMHDPSWASLVAPILSGEIQARSLTRLARRDRDYVYRMVTHLESPIPVDRTQRWFHEAPCATTAALVAAAKVRDADRILGEHRVTDLAPEDADRVAALLADTDTLLRQACVRYPDAVLLWVPRIQLGRALEWEHDEVLRHFAEAQARERWNFLATEAAFASLSPTSLHSQTALLDFAAVARASTPEGHPARAVLAWAEASRAIASGLLEGDGTLPRGDLEVMHQYLRFVDAVPDELDPDEVIAVGAFLFVVSPRTPDEAQAVLRGLSLLRGRCGGRPFAGLDDPQAWSRRTLTTREAQARALLAS